MDPDEAGIPLHLGDGAGAMSRFLREEILARFPGSSLHELEDASGVKLPSADIMLTTDLFVVDPPIFPGGDIGRLAVAGPINDLAASGARPLYLTTGLLLAEGFPWSDLRRILDSLAATAKMAGVEVVAGDTKTVGRNAGLGVCLSTTAVGVLVRPGHRYRLADARPGDVILVTGTVADHALAVLSQREGLGFEQRVVSDCAPLNELILPLLLEFDGIHSMRDPTRGGVAAVLHELAAASGLEVTVTESEIPVRTEVKIGCEMLGLNPLDLVNEGKMILLVAPHQAAQVLHRIRQHPLGRNAASIGEVHSATTGEGRVLIQGTRTRLLLRTDGAALPRLC